MITAPFNFVPLNKEVFIPSWREDVSHDVPFEDGESGIIDIKITAKSPIFIRDSSDETKFSHHQGTHYIPGSSLKGMVRNVLEIMSFAKMSAESFDDNTYAVRDLSSAKNFYMQQMQQGVSSGWLVKKENKLYIEDCGTPARIHHKQIDYAFGVDFASHFNSQKFDPQDKNQKTAEHKYNLVGGCYKKIHVSDTYKSKTNAKYDTREFCTYQADGKEGTLVLTGQPTERQDSGKMGDGKGFEFVFFDSKKEIAVPDNVWENFLFAYFDKRTTEPKESPDWTYWKEKLEKGEKVPVFFQKNENTIAHFGLSYLYKLPYRHSIVDGIPKTHRTKDADLAQTIFGYIDKEQQKALKGRVQFSHLKAISGAQELPTRTEILGTPRASYYPMYVKQTDGKLFTTMNDSFSISGRKRYPIHNGTKTSRTEDTGNDNVGTTFSPLKEGVVFEGKLRYHNLKKAELGAILSALTFHNTKGCYHNIGLAKPLGYGKIEIELGAITDITPYLKEFELQLGEQIENWSESEQITELLTMATPQDNQGNSKLKYMKLPDFANHKSKTKDYLRPYTKLDNIKTIRVTSLLSEEDKSTFLQRREAYKKRVEEERVQKLEAEKEKQRLKEQKEKYEEALDCDTPQIIQNFINKYPDDENIQVLQEKLTAMQQALQSNKHKEVEESALYAFNKFKDKKGKALTKDRDKFVKKWSAEKNNKGSKVVLDLVEKAKALK
jgi:CRISPR-associated protein (TIGR03986 family)